MPTTATRTPKKPKPAARAATPVIRALKLKDGRFDRKEGQLAAYGTWDYDDFLAPEHREWYDKWISFDCLLTDLQHDIIWCGIATFTSDICWIYDRKAGKFRSANYQKVGNRYDAKFHRSLLHDKDGTIWAATAVYHDPDRYLEAPGGAIVRIDPATEKIEVVTRPMPHVYIQSIEIDRKRGILYGQTYCPEYFFSYEIASGKFTNLGLVSGGQGIGQAETLTVDRNGTVWAAYALGRAWSNALGPTYTRLWSYHPDDGKPRYHKHGIPALDGSGYLRVDGNHLGPDGAIYMGSAEGALFRVDIDTAKVELIGKPAPGTRLTGMVNGHDGNLYGSCGRHGGANLFRYNPRSGKLDNLGPIFDPVLGEHAYQVHNMCITPDGTLYAGENDVPTRSSYLWEIAGVCPGKK